MIEEEQELIEVEEEEEDELIELEDVEVDQWVDFDEDDLTTEHADIIEDIKIQKSDLVELETTRDLLAQQIELAQATKQKETEIETLEEQLEEIEG